MRRQKGQHIYLSMLIATLICYTALEMSWKCIHPGIYWNFITVRTLSLLYFIFICIISHFYVWLMLLTSHLQAAGLSCASLPDNPFSVKSYLMLSIHFCFVLPFLLLFPTTSITINLLHSYPSSLLMTCPYNFNRLSCIPLDLPPTMTSEVFSTIS